MKYPILIKETHHNGRITSWTLYDQDHLAEVVDQAIVRSDYAGNGSLDSYFEWLGSDLAKLETFELEAQA